LDGVTPSAMRNAAEREWSVRIRSRRSVCSSAPRRLCVTSAARSRTEENRSVSYADTASWRTVAMRSKPIPVSTLGAGSGSTISPASSITNCMKTRL
jgi:hypothetical protein